MAARRRRRGRRLARETAMRLIYEADMAKRPPLELFEIRERELSLDVETAAYARALVESVSANRDDLDAAIGLLTPAWPVDQMARLDVAIMRIALTEIDADETPVAVAINEAVELAKRYCAAGAAPMINGALGSYVRQGAAAPVPDHQG
ncbi:MAG: transcription antitermination factor NusB [Chloroflexota bacterium]|nr:transcription antitermination factor NusB [Chloroflexota bacterium]MDE2919541.1 transcription antitermination factor NusB [Chloroflexota bacterium]